MIRLELNDTEQMDLQLEARRAVGRVSERIHFVLLSGQGNSPPEIGDLMGYEAATVRSWLQAYLENGMAGLIDAPRSGRPRKAPHLDDVMEAQVGQPPPVCWHPRGVPIHSAKRKRLVCGPYCEI